MSVEGIPDLIARLGVRNRRQAKETVAQLVAQGEAAIGPLASVLRSERVGSRPWNRADAALCEIAQAPTRHEVREQRANLIVVWAGGGGFALLLLVIGLAAGIGLWPSVIAGLVGGYVVWAITVTLGYSGPIDDVLDALMMLVDLVAAPFHYRGKVKKHATDRAAREELVRKYNLPD